MTFTLVEIVVLGTLYAGICFYKAVQTDSEQNRSWYIGMILGAGETVLLLLAWALLRNVL